MISDLEMVDQLKLLHLKDEPIIENVDQIEEWLETEMHLAIRQQKKEMIFPYIRSPRKAPLRSLNKEIGPYSLQIAVTQGSRDQMEDCFLIETIDQEGLGEIVILGIFDGHGGKAASKYVRDHFSAILLRYLNHFLKKFEDKVAIWNSFNMAFIDVNYRYNKLDGFSGTTALVTAVIKEGIWIANVGDCRSIFQIDNQWIQVTEDAKPIHLRDRKLVEALGGKILQVNKTKRVNGVLAVTRAIGNDNFLKLKKVGITCLPKITYMPLKGVKGWLLSSDGLFENITTQQWIGIIKKYSDQKVKHVPSD